MDSRATSTMETSATLPPSSLQSDVDINTGPIVAGRILHSLVSPVPHPNDPASLHPRPRTTLTLRLSCTEQSSGSNPRRHSRHRSLRALSPSTSPRENLFLNYAPEALFVSSSLSGIQGDIKCQKFQKRQVGKLSNNDKVTFNSLVQSSIHSPARNKTLPRTSHLTSEVFNTSPSVSVYAINSYSTRVPHNRALHYLRISLRNPSYRHKSVPSTLIQLLLPRSKFPWFFYPLFSETSFCNPVVPTSFPVPAL